MGRGDDQGEWEGVWWALPRRLGLEARNGLVGALREEVELTLEERAPPAVVLPGAEGLTEDIPRGVPEGKLRRNEEERETVGLDGVVEPWLGRGGTGVEEGWRSSRWRWRRERIIGSRLSGSCGQTSALVFAVPGGGGKMRRTLSGTTRSEESRSLSASGLSSSSILPSSSSVITLLILIVRK